MPLSTDIIGGTPQARAVAEAARQALTGDDKFYKKRLYFFELRVPTELGLTGGALFYPLLLNPQVYEVSSPFTIELTPTLGSGLYIEESGIIARTIRIAGTTGFKPRTFANTALSGLRALNELKASVVDYVPRGRANVAADRYSGQMQLFFLQDRIFNLYGGLKKNPKTAKDTKLIWHNPKDGEHWEVVPQRFTLRRAVPRSTMYFYEIELLAVAYGGATLFDVEVSEDRDFFDGLKDIRRGIQDAISLVEGVIANLANLERAIAQEFSGWVNLVNDSVALVGAASAFISGTVDLINLPFRAVRGVLESVDSAIKALENAVIAGATIPDQVAAEIADIGRGAERLSLFSDRFSRDLDARRKGLEARRTTTDSEAATATAATSFEGLRQSGTSPGPGDAKKSRALQASGGRRVEGAVEREVRMGDTLADLAARYLGDARRWREIAVLNNLRAPYTSATGIPGTARPGDRLIIPDNEPAPRITTSIGIITKPNASEPERLYGVDWKLEPVRDPTGVFSRGNDLVVNADGTDFVLARGLTNLAQAIRTRILIEQGSDPQYRQLGVPSSIGQAFGVGVDEEVLRVRDSGAVMADPRIVSVAAIEVRNAPQPDRVDVEIQAIPVGAAERLAVTFEAPRPAPASAV